MSKYSEWKEWIGKDSLKRKGFRIYPGQPINTTAFEEAIVLEENGVPTAAGLMDFNTKPYTVIQQGGMGAGKTAAHTAFMESLKTGPDGQQ